MIIPIKCFTCGNVLADKYRYFQQEVRKMKIEKKTDLDKVIYFTKKNMEKTPEGFILDRINIKNVWCRRHMLTHIDIE
jgi:DNA-directed RNA polymerase I, II, and III subunit RPABC5